MKLYYNTKGYGTADNKSIFTTMNDNNFTKPINLHTIKHIYPEFFL